MTKGLFFTLSVFFLTLIIVTAQEKNSVSVRNATYTSYHAAMGSGRGVIFRINLDNPSKTPVAVESLIVNNKPVKFITRQTAQGLKIESNYSVPVNEPSLNKDGSVNKQKEITDEVILKNKFYPSWVIINRDGKKSKIKIDTYTELPQKAKY